MAMSPEPNMINVAGSGFFSIGSVPGAIAAIVEGATSIATRG
jgi:hypothetical protein